MTFSMYEDLPLKSLAACEKSTVQVSRIVSPDLMIIPTSVLVGAYSKSSSRAIPANANEGVAALNAEGVAIAISRSAHHVPGLRAKNLTLASAFSNAKPVSLTS
jgi:hypothetical protein